MEVFMSISLLKSSFESLLARVLNLIGAGSVNNMNSEVDDVPFWGEQNNIA
jgi:hypothetical protein